MKAALLYHPDAYSTHGPKLMGRNAAGESFLRAYLEYQAQTEYWCAVARPEHAQAYAQQVRSVNPKGVVKAVLPHATQELARVGVLYLPGPGISDFAWPRGQHGHHNYSLCGITHTTASQAAMDAITQLVTAPVHPWDAVICTSKAVRANVMSILEAQLHHCRQRFGAAEVALPQLPVIPLGVHTADFTRDPQQQRVAREAWGIEEDDVVVLFVGRLSFHAKAHPLAMYQAMEAVAGETKRRLVLVECGWFANESIAQAFEAASGSFAPSIRVIRPDGRSPAERQQAWHAADIFCSLVDNIQESFGITPVEAMAGGLPVVVSDWDGYRDTVRHGVDGFRIPTLAPPGGMGTDLAVRHAMNADSYDVYCGYTSSLVAVDIESTTLAIKRLVSSKELRAEMGRAARVRARQIYDWSIVMRSYQQLWDELATRRAAAQRALSEARSNHGSDTPHPWPARLDPFHAFAEYPTQALAHDTLLTLTQADPNVVSDRLRALRQLAMVNYATPMVPTQEECEAVMKRASNGPARAVDLLVDIPFDRRPFVYRGLVWLIKVGVLRWLNSNIQPT